MPGTGPRAEEEGPFRRGDHFPVTGSGLGLLLLPEPRLRTLLVRGDRHPPPRPTLGTGPGSDSTPLSILGQTTLDVTACNRDTGLRVLPVPDPTGKDPFPLPPS